MEYLSFEIFKSNQDILRKNDISFPLPPESNETPSIKALISESQEAKLNMRFLMEKIRPIWEKKEKEDNFKYSFIGEHYSGWEKYYFCKAFRG